MDKLCNWFDRDRDAELDRERRERFESHLATCSECRTKALLLQNVVAVLRSESPPDLALSARQIAARALQRRSRSWEAQLLLWLRPAPAWAAVAVLMLLTFSGLFWSGSQQLAPPVDYEVLMASATSAEQAGAPASTWTDDQLEQWLAQGGGPQ